MKKISKKYKGVTLTPELQKVALEMLEIVQDPGYADDGGISAYYTLKKILLPSKPIAIVHGISNRQ
jgi:hypothetical protein